MCASLAEHPLTAYRRRHSLTLSNFAQRVPTTESTMSRIENGVRQPTVRLLRLIVAATDGEVTSDEIIEAAALALECGKGRR